MVEETTSPGGWVTTTVWSLAIIPAIFALVFHLGASYLSYKTYGSIGWAVLDFFFAVFYYPYYAFFLAGKGGEAPSAESASVLPPAVQSAGRRLRKMLKKH